MLRGSLQLVQTVFAKSCMPRSDYVYMNAVSLKKEDIPGRFARGDGASVYHG